ncbi:MAG: hypothetical protein WKF84_06650 [Pyrinomonadaceae bacterium]
MIAHGGGFSGKVQNGQFAILSLKLERRRRRKKDAWKNKEGEQASERLRPGQAAKLIPTPPKP